MKRHAWVALLLCALLLGLGLRALAIAEPRLVDFHYWRQADTAAFTHNYLSTTLNPLDPRLDRYPCELRDEVFGRVEAELPVAAWLAALPLAAVGQVFPPAPYLRGVSVLFYLGTCVYLFLLVLRLGESRTVAALSVLVFSILPVSAYFTRTIQPDGPALFFSCAFLYHLDRWLDAAGARLDRHALLGCVFGSLALLQKVSGAFLAIPALYWIVVRSGFVSSARNWRYWAWAAGIAVPVVAWYVFAARNPWTFGIWQDKYTSLSQLSESYLWRLFSERISFELVTWAGVVLLVIGLERMSTSRALRFAAVWLASVVVFIAATIPGNEAHAYYQLPIAPPAAIIIALGAMELLRRSWTTRAALVALVTVHLATTYDTLTLYYQPSIETADGSDLLERHVPRGARIVSMDRNPALFYNAGIQAWFTGPADLAAAERCMREEQFLLVDVQSQEYLDRIPVAKARLEAGFEKLEAAPLFTLWKKRKKP